jgi:hypothetical protein
MRTRSHGVEAPFISGSRRTLDHLEVLAGGLPGGAGSAGGIDG